MEKAYKVEAEGLGCRIFTEERSSRKPPSLPRPGREVSCERDSRGFKAREEDIEVAASREDALGLVAEGGGVTRRQERGSKRRARGTQALPARQREEEENTGVVGPAGSERKKRTGAGQ